MSKKPQSWSVLKIGKTLRQLGSVMAPDEKKALARAFDEYDIPPADQPRIVVRSGY